MSANLPLFDLEIMTGQPTEVSLKDLTEVGPDRLAEIEAMAEKAVQQIHKVTAATIVLGLVVVRVIQERLYTHRTVEDDAGVPRPMTVAEYLSHLQETFGVSASTLSRARSAANIYVLLHQAGIAPPPARAHLLPLRDADTAHVIPIYRDAVARYGEALTEDRMAEEVALFYGRPAKKTESSFAALKRKVGELTREILRGLETNDRSLADEKLQELLLLAGATPQVKPQRKSEQRVGRKTTRRTAVSSEPTKSPQKGKASPHREPPDFERASSAAGDSGPPPGDSFTIASSAGGDESPKCTIGTTTTWIEGNSVIAQNAPFAKAAPPPGLAVLRAAGFGWDRERSVWEKQTVSMAEAQKLHDTVAAAIADVLQA